MFEHKNLDGTWNRVIPADGGYLNGDILECRDAGGAAGSAPEKVARRQYAVVGDRLVERCLPPETLGDTWSHDSFALPWWDSVKNPPHIGIVADFNSANGGEHRKVLDVKHNIIGIAGAGEEIVFDQGTYTVVRQSDEKELSAQSMLELRQLYYG